jgi:hypothetical protein
LEWLVQILHKYAALSLLLNASAWIVWIVTHVKSRDVVMYTNTFVAAVFMVHLTLCGYQGFSKWLLSQGEPGIPSLSVCKASLFSLVGLEIGWTL